MIHSDPEILQGTPVFRGTRIPVHLIADVVAQGTPIREILEGYPSLTNGCNRLRSNAPKRWPATSSAMVREEPCGAQEEQTAPRRLRRVCNPSPRNSRHRLGTATKVIPAASHNNASGIPSETMAWGIPFRDCDSYTQGESPTNMELTAFQDLAARIKLPLQELFTFTLPGRCSVLPVSQDKQGQYWLLSCVLFEESPGDDIIPAAFEDFKTLRLPLFCVQTDTARLRSVQDITGFFEENDALFEELLAADESNQLDSIRSILGPAFIEIQSQYCVVNGVGDALRREDVCLIEESCISCMQNERQWVRVSTPSGFAYHRLPFDKVSLVPGAVRVRRLRNRHVKAAKSA